MHTLMIGVVSGILHIILFPIISCIVIIYVRHKYVSNWYSKEENAFVNRPMWKYFLKNSYLPHYFYFRQLELGVIFIAAICNEIFAENDIHIYLVLYIFLALFCSISYVYAKPFVQDEMWKLPIRLFTFFYMHHLLEIFLYFVVAHLVVSNHSNQRNYGFQSL